MRQIRWDLNMFVHFQERISKITGTLFEFQSLSGSTLNGDLSIRLDFF